MYVSLVGWIVFAACWVVAMMVAHMQGYNKGWRDHKWFLAEYVRINKLKEDWMAERQKEIETREKIGK